MKGTRHIFHEADPQRDLSLQKRPRADGAKVVIRGHGPYFKRIVEDLQDTMIEVPQKAPPSKPTKITEEDSHE